MERSKIGLLDRLGGRVTGRPSLVPENSSFFRAITSPPWNAAAVTKPARLIPADKSPMAPKHPVSFRRFESHRRTIPSRIPSEIRVIPLSSPHESTNA